MPADRVLAVEQATGVPRELLRPDLYQRTPWRHVSKRLTKSTLHAHAAIVCLRIFLQNRRHQDLLIDKVSRITGDASPLGLAWIALAEAAAPNRRQRTAAGAGVFQAFRRRRAWRCACLRLVLPRWLPARAPPGRHPRAISLASASSVALKHFTNLKTTSPRCSMRWPA